MKKLKQLSKEERMTIVLDIVQKLKHLSANNEKGYIDIYKKEYPAIKELMEIFNTYIRQEDDLAIEMSGKIDFPELNRTIHYLLPINERRKVVFKMEWKR